MAGAAVNTEPRTASEPEDGAQAPALDGIALCRWVSFTILLWASIWVFLFQHANPRQNELIFLPILSLFGFTAIVAAGYRIRFGPWVYWLGALLVHAALAAGVLNPSGLASGAHTNEFLRTVALGLPVLLALGQAALGARILCGICIALSLIGLLDNIGLDLRAAVASIMSAEWIRIEMVTDRQDPLHLRSQRAHSVWMLFLAWIALAALRPAAWRDWLAAAGVFVMTALVVATGYSWATKLAFILSTGVFFAAFRAPRFVRTMALVALLVLFLGAPVGAKAAGSGS